jgi:serine protease
MDNLFMKTALCAAMLCALNTSAVNAQEVERSQKELVEQFNEVGEGLIIQHKATQHERSVFKAGQLISSLSKQLGVEVFHKRFDANQSQIVTFGNPQPVEVLTKLAKQLTVTGNYQFVEVNRYFQPTLTPNDSRLGHMWGLINNNTGIRAEAGWDSNSGSNVTVAVLDTGFRPHADLADNIVGGYDFVSSAFMGNDNNGRDADARDPGDAVSASECGWSHSARNSSWHGTHVAGTIAAVGNNGQGVVGTAYNANILPVRVLGKCGGTTADIADAIVWASGGNVSGVPTNAFPADVINLSLGGNSGCSSTYQSAINQARNNGVTLVVAAGNSGRDVANFSPASCDGVIAVAAHDQAGLRSVWSSWASSNFGSKIDVSAPGTGILSTLNSGTNGPGADNYVSYNGTSMATPHVAGVVAQMLHQSPYLSPTAVEMRIKHSARTFLPGSSCNTSNCGDGMLDAPGAIALASSPSIEYRAHVANNGWLEFEMNGDTAGTTGESRRMEALQMFMYNSNMGICYNAHVAGIGWQPAVCDGDIAGTTYQSRRVEAVRIWLNNRAPGCSVEYRAHVAGQGWLNWVPQGGVAGTTGQSRRMEALQARLTGNCD